MKTNWFGYGFINKLKQSNRREQDSLVDVGRFISKQINQNT